MVQIATASSSVHRRDPRDAAEAGRFVAYLVAQAAIDRLAAERALQAQRETRERIDTVLLQLGLLTEAVLYNWLAGYFGLKVMTAAAWPAGEVLPGALDTSFLRRMRLVLVAADPGLVVLATADPFATDTIASVGFMLERRVEVRVATPSQIARALDGLHGDQPDAAPQTAMKTPGEPSEARGLGDDVERLRDLASEAPVIRLVHRLISNAIAQRASDVHIEPFADGIRVRYRIDGVMTEVERLPADLQTAVASRIKVIAKLDVAERRVPQDGRTLMVHGGREIDLRIATAPLLHGESLVLRILDRDAIALDFPSLGFEPTTIAKLEALLAQPNGIVLVTGPTGSGKTTTLYAALSSLNGEDRKIFTVEDPIEYQLAGINQMQVKPTIGFDFAAGLRSILRQDPDVVMVGEMRDAETARTGIQAALTGHLVLSTLHTNSAAASVTRLLDMGMEDYLLASSLSGIVAQRLVRRLCRVCALPDGDATTKLAELLGRDHQALANAKPMRACGCEACRNTGFQGRTTIVELLALTATTRAQIKHGVTDRQLEATATADGMETLLVNGLSKVARGETTLAEVLRVARS